MKNTTIFLVLCSFIVSMSVSAANISQYTAVQDTITLWENGTPNGDADQQANIYVFLPERVLATGRAVIACPGGAYASCSPDNEGSVWAPFFNKQGIALIVLQYRLPRGNKEVPMSDAYEAIRVVKDSADNWNINKNDIGIMGSSAGGHLASTIATHAPAELRPAFQILFYPVISMTDGLRHADTRTNFLGDNPTQADIDLYSSEKQVTATTPRAFIIFTDDDYTVTPKNGTQYYQALRDKRVPASLFIYPKGGHGWASKTINFRDQMENNLVLWLNDFGEEYVHGMPETLSIVGGAVAETGGQPLVMKKDGGLFEIYTSLTAGTYSFDDTNLSGGGTVAEDGVYRIRVDYRTEPVTVDRQKINRLYAWYPWGQLDLFDLSYAGNSTFKVEDKTWTPTSDNRFRIRMQVGDDNTIETYGPKDGGTFVLIGNGQWGAGNDYNYGVDKSKYFKTGLPFSMTVDLSPATGYSVTVTDYISDQDINDYSLTVMGSSVPNGEGATGKVGYAQMYQQYLASEAQHSWTVIHKSVNGNNTTQLMARWGRDFLPTKSRYIYYGLSLANEGIRTSGQTAFNSYQNNMATLIAWARDIGRVPLAGNVYPQSLYNATDYNYVKRMNLLMHEWDIPTVNLLGAVDDGNGRWVSDCRYDDGHPNTKGHTEMFYAFVPSLLDALSEGKAQPQLDGSTSITLTKDNAQQIVWNPENILHSFTLSFSFKTGATSGTIASFTTENNSSAYLEIDADGKLVYHTVSASGQLKSSASVNDGTWHQVSLTHYYARGATFLYMDGIPVTGSIAERLAPTRFCLNDIENTLESVDFRDLFFHRSGMTPEEIAALHSGRMLKSSLEIYAPLDDSAGTPDLYNSAQSLNTLSMEDQNSSSDIEDIIYMMDTDFKEIAIYSITGQLVLLSSDTYLNSLDTLKTGVYVVKMATWKGEMTTRKIAVK